MKHVTRPMALLLSYLLIFQPIMANDHELETKKKRVLFTTLELVKDRQVFGRESESLISKTIDERQKLQLKQLRADYDALSSGELKLSDYLDELASQNMKKSSIQKVEIKGHLAEMDEFELDVVASILVDNPNYQNELLEYNASFTKTERLNALLNANYRDFDYLNSMAQKRIRAMSLDDTLKSIKNTERRILVSRTEDSFMTKKELMKALQIAGAVLLVVGVVTWSRYYGDYKDAKKKRENELTGLKTRLQNELDIKSNELTNEELGFLNDNGYQYMQCGSYSRPDSIICSNYGYTLISGTKYCSVYCYKNITTGKETLHAPPTCTSPFIPTDCDDPHEYSRGYSAGYDLGYPDGDSDGYWDGDRDGADDGSDDGYDDGYDDSFNNGYDDGFDDGYWAGSAESLKSIGSKVEVRSTGYERGHEQGHKDAILFKNLSGF